MTFNLITFWLDENIVLNYNLQGLKKYQDIMTTFKFNSKCLSCMNIHTSPLKELWFIYPEMHIQKVILSKSKFIKTYLYNTFKFILKQYLKYI